MGNTGTQDVPDASGGLTFTEVVNQTGASLTGWGTQNGTWASDGSVIEQSNASATTDNLAVLTGDSVGALAVLEAEIQIPTASFSNSDSLIGVGLVKPSASGAVGGQLMILGKSGGNPTFQNFTAGGGGGTLLNPPTLAADTWYKVRMVFSGRTSLYLDDILVGSAFSSAYLNCESVALYCYRGGKFRNIKAWELDYSTLPV